MLCTYIQRIWGLNAPLLSFFFHCCIVRFHFWRVAPWDNLNEKKSWSMSKQINTMSALVFSSFISGLGLLCERCTLLCQLIVRSQLVFLFLFSFFPPSALLRNDDSYNDAVKLSTDLHNRTDDVKNGSCGKTVILEGTNMFWTICPHMPLSLPSNFLIAPSALSYKCTGAAVRAISTACVCVHDLLDLSWCYFVTTAQVTGTNQ